MDKRQRIAQQRALVRAAIGKLRAVEELFGIEDGAVAGGDDGFLEYQQRVDELEVWLFHEGPLA